MPLVQNRCKQLVPLFILFPAAVGHCQLCSTADKLSYVGASQGCLLTVALPASHAHCFDLLCHIHFMLTLHTITLMVRIYIRPFTLSLLLKCEYLQGPFIFFFKSILLAIVLFKTTPAVTFMAAAVLFMNEVLCGLSGGDKA